MSSWSIASQMSGLLSVDGVICQSELTSIDYSSLVWVSWGFLGADWCFGFYVVVIVSFPKRSARRTAYSLTTWAHTFRHGQCRRTDRCLGSSLVPKITNIVRPLKVLTILMIELRVQYVKVPLLERRLDWIPLPICRLIRVGRPCNMWEQGTHTHTHARHAHEHTHRIPRSSQGCPREICMREIRPSVGGHRRGKFLLYLPAVTCTSYSSIWSLGCGWLFQSSHPPID